MIYWIGFGITLLAAYLIFRIVVRRDYLKRGCLSGFSTALEFMIFALHANLPYLYLGVPWPTLPALPENPILRLLGLSIGGLGLLVTLFIMSRLGFGTTIGQRPGEVRQSGPYRLTRNPQLLSYGALLLGLGIMYPSIQTAAWILLYGAITHMMVLTEEEHLTNQFNEKYLDYCSRVPRYLGRSKGILKE